jgi:phosphatidate phosphatase APP1
MLPWSAAMAASPAILLFPGLGRPDLVVVSGRVLTEAPSKGSSALSKNLRRLLVPNWEGAPVVVRVGDQSQRVLSGRDGHFEVEFRAHPGQSFPVGLFPTEASVGEVIARGVVQVVADDAPFLVISDFDDTLAVTNVLAPRALFTAALLQDEGTQPAVSGMSELLSCFGRDKGAAPGFALVSGSPVQYVPRTSRFLVRHRYPFFGLYLRNLGPGTLSDYKQPKLRWLLERFHHRVLLVGDSGERDPEVYRQLADEFPGRVLRIYIRNAGRSDPPARFQGQLLFSTPGEAAADALERGLISRECYERSFESTSGSGATR